MEQTLHACPRDGWRLVVVKHPDDPHHLIVNCAHPACGQWWDLGTTSQDQKEHR